MTRYVLGFYLTRSGVILIRKSRPEWQRGKFNGIGGSIEDDEAPIDAMIREFAEEAGIKTTADTWTERFVLSGGVVAMGEPAWSMHVFSAFGELPSPYMPREIDEGVVLHAINHPMPMDSTADWLLRMCRDLYLHQISLTCSQSNLSLVILAEGKSVGLAPAPDRYLHLPKGDHDS